MGPLFYNLACVYAQAVQAVLRDQSIAEDYAQRAIELLKRSATAGYSRSAADVKHARNDDNLKGLRQRAEFQELLTGLEAKVKSSEKDPAKPSTEAGAPSQPRRGGCGGKLVRGPGRRRGSCCRQTPLLRYAAMEEMAARGPLGTILDEATLVARMQAGDDHAFEACVRAYSGQLLLVARRILRNEEDARDAVQDAFLSAFKGIGRFEGLSRLGTWLHRIAVNAALGRLRTLQRHPERSIEHLLPHFGEGEHQLDPPVPWKATPETSLQQKETCELVRHCISQLPDTYRTVLLLRDIEGLDTEETAQMLGASLGVVKTRLHRARQALRSLLDPHFRRGNV